MSDFQINTQEHSILIRHSKNYVLKFLEILLNRINNNDVKINTPYDNFVEDYNLNNNMSECHDVSHNADYDDNSQVKYLYYPYTVSYWYNKENINDDIKPVTMEYTYVIKYQKKLYHLVEYRTNDVHVQTSLMCIDDPDLVTYWFNVK
jgi:hypothetical protein